MLLLWNIYLRYQTLRSNWGLRIMLPAGVWRKTHSHPQQLDGLGKLNQSHVSLRTLQQSKI